MNRLSFLRDRGLNKNEFLGCPLGQKCGHWGEAVVQRFPFSSLFQARAKTARGLGGDREHSTG